VVSRGRAASRVAGGDGAPEFFERNGDLDAVGRLGRVQRDV
jgi:hypothetical protein